MSDEQSQPLKTVCGSPIFDPADHPKAEYKGETVYLCGPACLRVFEEDPEAYIQSYKREAE